MTNNVKIIVGLGIGVYFSYMIYGILQERLKTRHLDKLTGTRVDEPFEFTYFLMLVQCIGNLSFAFASPVLFPSVFGVKPGLPSTADVAPSASASSSASLSWLDKRAWAGVSFTYVLAMYLSNLSLGYIDYPSQALGKAAKPVSVLVITLLGGRQYAPSRFVSVGLISIGIVMFFHDKVSGVIASSFSSDDIWIGRLYLAGSLLADGFTAALQERAISRQQQRGVVTSCDIMFITNVWAALFMLVGAIVSGQIFSGFLYSIQRLEVIGLVVAFSLSSAVGQLFIFTIITRFGTLLTSIITTTRKFATILLSVVLFGHALSWLQWIAIVVVFSGLGLDVYSSKAGRKVINSKQNTV